MTCQKTILRGPMGSNHCKSCDTKMRYDQSVKAKLAEVEAEKIRSQRSQASKTLKPLFRKKIRGKNRTEKIHRPSDIVHDHITPLSPLEFDGLSQSGETSQAALPSRKRKHGKGLIIDSKMG